MSAKEENGNSFGSDGLYLNSLTTEKMCKPGFGRREKMNVAEGKN